MARQAQEDLYARREKIERLDPIEDYIAITQLFYQDFQNAIWLQTPESLMISYSVPSMAKILHGTGEYEKDYRKRFVDQGVLVATMQRRGFAPGPGRDAVRRMNGMHRQYPILAEDFEMIGCATIVGPGRLAERFGWREVTAKEKAALAHSSVLMMRHMGISDFPRSYEEQRDRLDWHLDHRAAFSEDAVPLGRATVEYFTSIEDEPLRSLVGPILCGVIDPRIVRALGLEVPGPEVSALMTAYVTAMGSLDPVTDDTHPTIAKEIAAQYPGGFDVTRIGTHQVDADTSVAPR
ncbi:hypothetical protein J2S43_001486 [Catenuloplanes nepalensis]|uniref:ER-bound oxygenase mpaB/mpaB'/Rubber oxygenase catalytic domain-containing protein n=1 Tax=Catenuloplanes nepalensis TaxID=587533 RepID=A0ABT9MNG8_9ACTN|nr:oxygenase MpaB family protein [Catenuloplanes nepalensis]MDP9792974.1 hypothetical protein [Catenuloplanes nepalensis]